MLTELLVKASGGFFLFRKKVNNAKFCLSRKLYFYLYLYYLDRHNSYIGLGAIFKNKPWLPHGITGIFISDSAIIGKDCIIFPNVIIGSNTLPDSKTFGAPIIGNNCIIGAGATIIGNIRIGDNCHIGANATVFRNIPSSSIVVSSEPRVIAKKNVDNRFYIYRNDRWHFYKNEKLEPIQETETIEKLNNRKLPN